MGRVGMEGISTITCARLNASVSYYVPVEAISLEVRNLKIKGAKGCFYSPEDLISVQQRWINTK